MSWFKISTNYDTYQQYRIKFWGIRYDIDPIISTDIVADIGDMADIDDIGNVDTRDHWLIPTDTKI